MTQQNVHTDAGFGVPSFETDAQAFATGREAYAARDGYRGSETYSDADSFEASAPTVAVVTGAARATTTSTMSDRTTGGGHPVFRPTTAFQHDTERPGIDPTRVAADWQLMYEWLERDAEMASVCGFSAEDLSYSARSARVNELMLEVGPGRTFTVLPNEMQFWVRYSWINSDRCSGRQHALQQAVIQYRPEVRGAVDMLRAAVDHANMAMNAPVPPQTVITVLGGPVAPGELGPMFVTEQMLRAAGYHQAEGGWSGDGGYLDVTDWVRQQGGGHLIQSMPGYRPGSFDVLPMLAMGEDGELVMARVPNAERYLIDIPWPRHPETNTTAGDDSGYGEPFACWPAIPLQTNFDIDIAGQRYCTIFNGWYVDEELATNFLDPRRYDWADRIGEAIHGPVDAQMLSRTDKFDEYRMAQIEIATLRAIRAGFKSNRMKINNLSASQSGFAKFCQRHLATHGEMPPNDTGWTSNRIGSRFRFPSHPVPHKAQERGAVLVKHWLTVKSLRPNVPVHIVDLEALEPSRPGRHAAVTMAEPITQPNRFVTSDWSDEAAPERGGCPVNHGARRTV
ncbi:nitric oxide synthase oxygenase [Kineosporia succinea]|uniref:Nitric oxide synthase oxygenase domain/subunit n=1 Tax=Kineosporia succinea TaxID=84632 RepID=A0ABT9PBT4_9ACTN|nr:nitric oxide synthase oxygenase [Kineosporia succinea]MDP9829859.1 nitric oxide synthase oxygenase domain/subunit [Kineosporia succinea]